MPDNRYRVAHWKVIMLVFTLGLFTVSTAFAGLLTSNGYHQISVHQGESFSRTTTIHIDPDDPPMNFSVEVYGITQGLDGYAQINNIVEDNYAYTAKPFINVSPSHFHLEPGSSQDIIISGTVPSNIKGPGRYAMVFTKSDPIGDGSIGICLATMIPVVVTVLDQNVTCSGEIKDLFIKRPITTKYENVSFIFANTGNYHYKVKVESILRDKNGTILANTSEPLSIFDVKPLFSVRLETSLVPQAELKPGDYSVDAKVIAEDGTVLASREVKFHIPLS